MGETDPLEALRSWSADQRKRDRATRIEALASFALLWAIVVIMAYYLARLDARSADLHRLAQQQQTATATR